VHLLPLVSDARMESDVELGNVRLTPLVSELLSRSSVWTFDRRSIHMSTFLSIRRTEL